MWIRKVLKEIFLPVQVPTLLPSYNVSGISWAERYKLPFKRSKHIDVRVHFIRDLVVNNKVKVENEAKEQNDAHIITKPLEKITLNEVKARISFGNAGEEEC